MNRVSNLFVSFLFCISLSAAGQSADAYKFRIYLKDKGNVSFSIHAPEKFLSPDAIERKQRQGVAIDEADFPISADYFDMLRQRGAEIITHSKWFKTIVVQLNDSAAIDGLKALPFVASAKYIWKGYDKDYRPPMRSRLGQTDCPDSVASAHYLGITQPQFAFHHAESMMDAGFHGKGIRIGIIDAGFTNYDVIPYFKNSRFGGFKDFVPAGEMFSSSDHGTRVFSTMAMKEPHIMMGSAPDATYWLFRSEDVASEFPVEEDYWTRAIEYADSLGMDVINTSLGYNSFDDKRLNYSHRDLDGVSSLMTLAADKAHEKGMLVMVSAGNAGRGRWGKITFPGDAKYAVTVGAASVDSLIAPFSSRGPTYDGRVKPDFVSVGRGTVTIGRRGTIGTANGTSFSTPFLAGLFASLWSINPDVNRSELIEIVRQSSDRYAAPDSVFGYGIPNFDIAMRRMLHTLPAHNMRQTDSICSILPTEEGYRIKLLHKGYLPEKCSVKVLNSDGLPISDMAFDGEREVLFPFSRQQKRYSTTLYFLIENPYRLRTYRIKVK